MFHVGHATAAAASVQSGSIEVDAVHAPPTPPVATVGAVYLTIVNHGAVADRLVAVATPAADKVELHKTSMQNGLMQMREVQALDCPPHATVKVEPGALHLMLVGLKKPLVTGASFPLTLTFRDAGMLTVQVSVKP